MHTNHIKQATYRGFTLGVCKDTGQWAAWSRHPGYPRILATECGAMLAIDEYHKEAFGS